MNMQHKFISFLDNLMKTQLKVKYVYPNILVPAEWHQYDGMVQPTPQKDWWQFWPKDTFANNNILSVQMLLPKWECFIEEENPSPQTIKQVLSEIEKVETTMKPLFVDKNGKYDGGKQFRKVMLLPAVYLYHAPHLT